MMTSRCFSAYYSCFLIGFIALAGCSKDSSTLVLGTLERDRIVLTATASEIIVEVLAKEGSRMLAGEPVLRLDDQKQQAIVASAQAEVQKAEAYLAELNSGARPEEIAAARSQVASHKALYIEAQKQYERTRVLVERSILTDADLDSALAKQSSLFANLQNARDKLQLLLQGTRIETLEQAEASLAKASSALKLEQQKLQELTIHATRDGWLDSLPRHHGERVSVGTPLAILLADEAPYARVYIPEPVRAQVRVGDQYDIHIDGIERTYSGAVRRVSLDPAFTPHYALNEKERTQLVYLAEIQLPPSAGKLPTGIPVQMELH